MTDSFVIKAWHMDLLRLLETNARYSNDQLAVMLGVEVQSVTNAIQEFEQQGVVTGYRARIKWDAIGVSSVESFIDLSVQPERGYGYDRIADRIKLYPEVVSVHLVTGSQDLRVVVRGATMHDVASFVAERLATLDGVKSTATRFVLKCYKADGDVFTAPDNDMRLAVTP